MFKISTPASPNREIVVSITVHDRKVCFMVRLKNSLNIQKPESLTWDPKTLPDPTASTINSGDTVPDVTRGDTTPAAVIPATVAEPMATLNNAVTTQPKSKGGICHLPLNDAIYLSVPLSCNTCLKTPPAVIIIKITEIPPMASFSHFILVSIVFSFFGPKQAMARNTDNNKAIVGSPVKMSIFFSSWSGRK